MSQNHPHDNIYSILGKLDALKPTPDQTRADTVKRIYESVEAQGSILSGVDKVQAKLAQQFAESQVNDDMTECTMCEAGTCQEASHQARVTMKHVNASNASAKEKAAIGKASKDMKPGSYSDREAMLKAAGIPDTRGPVSEDDIEETVTKGPDTYGRSYYNDPDFTGATPVKAKNPTGQRGRPKKADSEKSSANLPQFGKKFNDPFGRVPGEPPKGKKGVVHSMDESLKKMSTQLSRISEGVNLQAMLREKHQTVEEMLAELSDDMTTFKETGHMSELLRDCMEIKGAHGRMVADEAAQRGDSFAPQFPASPAPQPTFLDKAKAMGKKFMDVVGHPDDDKILDPLKQQVGGNHYNEDEELNELARLAGLTVAENVDKAKFAALAEPKDEITYADKIAGATMADEGNAFGHEVRQKKLDDIPNSQQRITTGGRDLPVKEEGMEECGMEDDSNSNINVSTNMSSNGDKSVTVTANGAEAEALMQMLALAGLGVDASQMTQPEVGEQPMEVADEGAEIEVDDAGANPVNAPEEQYYSMRASTMGPGEGDNGEKAMHPDRPTKNNGDNALAKPANEAVIALEAQLAAEYESIKKTTR